MTMTIMMNPQDSFYDNERKLLPRLSRVLEAWCFVRFAAHWPLDEEMRLN